MITKAVVLRASGRGVYVLLTLAAGQTLAMAAKRQKPRVYRRKTSARKPARRGRAGARRKATKRQKPTALFWRYTADAGVFCFTLLLGLAALFALIARDLPDTNALWRDGEGAKITLIARDGAPLTVRGASIGAPIRLQDLPVHVPHAILAVEDRNFYHHFGVNPFSVIRAALANMRSGSVVQGGSTLTQQLAKNIFLSPERTVKRKVQELLLAFWLEQKFTKDEILTLYLNRVYFGAGAYGIDAASYRYFGKPAARLELGEAAVLAGLLKAPSRLAPTSNPVDAGKRGRLVIEQMVDAGFLDRRRAAETVARPILLAGDRFSAAPYFVDYVLAEVRKTTGSIDADLIVRTTFDRRLQDAAELGFAAGLARADDTGDNGAPAQGAVVMLEGTGAIRAMIGGRDYASSQFNRAAQARRQPGSAFKPFIFLAAMEAGASPDDIVDDAPLRIGAWSPDNYKGQFFGEVSHREALARSLNAASLKVQETTGRERVRLAARASGWPASLSRGPALGLGVDAITPIGLAGAYAPFANGGFRVSPYAIESIATVDGDIIYQHTTYYQEQAANPSSIAAVNDMMGAVVAWGTGKNAQVPGYAVAGKTGTTQDNRDAWFAGHGGGLVCVVWLGRDDNSAMPGMTGGLAPAIIWSETMSRALPPRYVAPLRQAGDAN